MSDELDWRENAQPGQPIGPANSIVYADSSGVGQAATIAEEEFVGRETGGEIGSIKFADVVDLVGAVSLQASTPGTQQSGNINVSGAVLGGTAKIGGATDYAEVLSDGTVRLRGAATAFDDLFFPFTASKLGANAKPDWDYTNVGLLFPQKDTSEYVQIIVQLPHRWKEGSTIYPHIHYKRTDAGKPTFKIAYAWFSVGDEVATPSTVVSLDTEVYEYEERSIHQINKSASGISGSGKTLSSLLLINLYRDDDVATGDVLAYQFDIHFEIDSFGSAGEYEK